MKLTKTILTVTLIGFLSGCGNDNALTKEEVIIQSNADIAVSEILFDAGLDSQASYNVRKNGHVEIEFVESVAMFDYTLAVEKLRSHPAIKSVSAEQAGSEVCILRGK